MFNEKTVVYSVIVSGQKSSLQVKEQNYFF